ncbi:MAG: peptidoglycan-binding domain-containing protein [Candidatus Paceibacterota bacterium]
MKIKKFFIFSVAVVVLFVATLSFTKNEVSASTVQCDFTKDLEIGSVGEDVRCLQRYLNAEGFKIAESGIGSPGQETNTFGMLTKEAVMRWQAAHNFSLKTGTFGPMSRSKYLEKIAAGLTSQLASMGATPVTSATPSVNTPVVVQNVVSVAEKDARSAIEDAFEALNDAEDAADDIDDSNDEENAREDISDAKDDLIEAFKAFLAKDFEKARTKAEDVSDSLGDIVDEVFGDEDDAQEAIDDAQEAIDDAENEINDADDDGDSVHDANDKLDDAKDKLDDARDAFDDKEYDRAENLANQAEDMADEAVDLIGD